MTLPKPLDMSDSEILDWIYENASSVIPMRKLGKCVVFTKMLRSRHIDKGIRQAVCQAASILRENEK